MIVPPAWLIGAAAAFAALSGAGFAGWHARGVVADRAAAEAQAHTATLREQAIHAALVETTRRLARQQEAADAAEKRARRARADAAAADAAAGSLRDYAAGLAASAAACDPAPAAERAPDRPADLLADMLGRLEAHGRELARAADQARSAGAECVERYEALTQGDHHARPD